MHILMQLAERLRCPTILKMWPRLAIGRVIVGSALSVAAGSALYLVPELHPLALLGIGSALGLAGLQGVELWLKRKGINAGAGKL